MDSECEVMKERARTILAAMERESEKDSKAMTPTTPRYNAAVVSAPVAGMDEDDDAEGSQEEDGAFFVLAFEINYREDDSMELKPVWDSSGSLEAMKTACSVPLPQDSEELRSRITLLGTAWVMAAMHQTNNPLLKDSRLHNSRNTAITCLGSTCGVWLRWAATAARWLTLHGRCSHSTSTRLGRRPTR